MVENLEFIHPAEVDICNKVAELGNSYRKMCQFYDEYAFGKDYENKPLKYGLYLQMFCDALNTVILKPYTLIISDLESKLLKEHYLNVTFLQSHLEHYYSLFFSINSLIDEIINKKLHGCQIIDLVYKYTISGNEIIKEAFNRILTINNEVMYKQMRNWMIYGNLEDKYEEFFVCYDNLANSDSQKEAASRDEDNDLLFSNETDELFIGSRFSSKHSQFALNSARLPSYINIKIANKILFAGELLQLFKSQSLDEIYSSTTIQGNPNISQLSQNLSFVKLQNVVHSDKFLQNELNILHEKLDVFSKKIWDISKQTFSIISFETLITEIRNYISESVWSLIVEKYNLLEEFQKLKYMFLIGRGELFATFLDTSKALLNKSVDSNFEYNINYYFQKSISRMLLDDEVWLTKFRIILNDENIFKKKLISDGWERIGLSYKVEWPFSSLITSKVLKKYNEIFNYLLSIRRVQIELNQSFLLQMRVGIKQKDKKFIINPKVWLTRNHMSFLIDNLQFYLQADVLETQFAELENNIKMTKDFEQIRYTHDTFLTKIQFQSFILNKTVWVCLNDIMESCLTFSSLLGSFDEAKHQEFAYDKVEIVIRQFQNQTHTMYTIFKSMEKRQPGSHLEQLITRLNFNNYLAEHNGIL